MHGVLLAFHLWLAAQLPQPLVVEEVDTICIAHVRDGAELVFFFDIIQGEWACLDHRWLAFSMQPRYDGERFTLYWRDDGDDCYRLVKARRWIESYEDESPLAVQHNRPWFARLLAPGLKQPPPQNPQ